MQKLRPTEYTPPLTINILTLWREGWNTYEIAKDLHLTEATICSIMARLQRDKPLHEIEV